MSTLTDPRQVRLRGCTIYSPGMELRAVDATDRPRLRAGLDVTPYIRRVDIYESIFNNTLSGSLTIMEDVGLVEYLPIVGVEILTLAFDVTDEKGQVRSFRNAFRVSKVHNMSYPRNQLRLYTIEFVSQEFVRSVGGQRISRSFAGSASDAVKSIITQDLAYDGKLDIEPSFGKLSVTVPNYTGLQAINFFALMAQTVETPHESNFLFFERLDGYHFTSIRKLIQDGKRNPNIPVFNVDETIAAAPKLEDARARHAAARVSQEQSFDLLHDIASGTLRAGMLHFDILARRVGTSDVSALEDSRYTQTFKQTTHLDKYPVYPNNYDKYLGEDVRLFTVPSNVWIAGSKYLSQQGEVAFDLSLRKSIILRNRQLREIQHIRTLLDLPGHPELRAGTVVRVNYPSSRVLSDDAGSLSDARRGHPTPMFSGLHLVADVHHIITMNEQNAAEYRMNIKVVRDSLGSPLMGDSD